MNGREIYRSGSLVVEELIPNNNPLVEIRDLQHRIVLRPEQLYAMVETLHRKYEHEAWLARQQAQFDR